MQYMLHNGPYRAQPQPQRRLFGLLGHRFTHIYAFALKLVLIGCVTAVFFQLVAFLLTLSNSGWMQMVALLAWSCGAVPLVYLLWRLDFGSATRSARVIRQPVEATQHTAAN